MAGSMRRTWNDLTLKPSDITPENVYINRRQFFKMGAIGLGAVALSACGVETTKNGAGQTEPDYSILDELGDPATSYDAITGYNNYYEFSLGKEEVASLAGKLSVSPWEVAVDGLVNRPKTFSIEEILSRFPREERIYRMRCVEGWSMVIPWLGFPLANLLKEVEPTGDARYVRFVTSMQPESMPGLRNPAFPWPYTEGLRLDEAMHDLTLLSTGLYGKEMPKQNGAPLRLVVPWKYGFKSIKSIVKIELTAEQPDTLWSSVAPNEYGFYSNVNPNKPHPRWSQETERRIGEFKRRDTLMFNGYAKSVAGLYTGMDLNQYF